MLENQLGHNGKRSRSCTYTFFLPQGLILSLFSLHGQRFPTYRQILKNYPYLGMKLGPWQKFQKLHIYSLSTPMGSKLNIFLLYKLWFPRYGPISNIAILGYGTCPLAKLSEVAHTLCFYLRGSLSLFGLETWSLSQQIPKLLILSFCPKWSKLSLFSLYRCFRGTGLFSKLPY